MTTAEPLTPSPSDELLVDRADGVVTITFNRPHRKNAMTPQNWQDLLDALIGISFDESVRAVVLTGAEGSFCAGADLSVKRAVHPLTHMRRVNQAVTLLHELPQPVIAVVQGPAVGAGCNLALGCDFVIADPTARFCEIFATRGLSIDGGGSWILPRLVGMRQAKRLAMLGEFVGAEEALELGMVTWVKETEEIPAFVADLTQRLVDGPPVALATIKALLHQGASQSFTEALANEARAQPINFGTDSPEAGRAFMEKRAPQFEGRWLL